MNIWLKRVGYLLIVAVWLFLMLLPIGLFRLARQGQLEMGNTRVFLVQERQLGGVGFETWRDARGDSPCQQVAVRYVMWTGSGENTVTCSCNASESYQPDGRQCVLQ